MTDIIDRAAQLEEQHRQAALQHWAEQQNQAPISAYHCEACGEIIPEKRRQAITGCRYCIDCQTQAEQRARRQA